MSKPSGGIARCPRCPPGACQRRLLPLPVLVMLIFRCFLVQAGNFISYGVCKLVEGFTREVYFLVQPCRNRPAEFARCPRCPPGACQRRWLPLPVLVMLIFKCFLMQVGDFYFFTVLANKPPLKGVGDQRSWWRGSAEIFYSCFRFHGRNPSVSLWLPVSLSGEPVA